MKWNNWVISKLNKSNAVNISKEFDFPIFLSVLLDIMGFSKKEQMDSFFSNDLKISNPLEIKDMDKAVKRVQQAVERFEKICVYGDYDVDGVTATALLYSYLQMIGANVIYYIPRRLDEGYGLSEESIKKLSDLEVDLIITVDNGIASINEVEIAKSLNIDVVITDHHRQHGSDIPNAIAVVDPHRLDCDSKFKDLAGVGVALKLVLAMENEYSSQEEIIASYSDLAVLGTVADMVPLVGENRVLVKAGLKEFKNSNRVGLLSLMHSINLKPDKLNTSDISFFLAPRLNAVGRLGSSERAVKLLISDDEEEAQYLSKFINEQNDLRKEIESQIYKSAKSVIKLNPEKLLDRIIIIEGENWNSGVIGIVASKFTNEYGKPTIIISKMGEEAVASGRSVEGFSLYDALYKSKEFLTKFGGHPMAVGFSIKTDDIEKFSFFINDIAKESNDIMPNLNLNIECKLNMNSLNLDMVNQMKLLEPFGHLNPKPIFGIYNVVLNNITPVSNGKHLRLEIKNDKLKLNVMKFNTTLKEFLYEINDVIDLAVNLEISEFNLRKSLSIFARDVRISGLNYDQLFFEKHIYEKIKKKESINDKISFLPTRDEFVYVYRFIKSLKNNSVSIDSALFKLQKHKIGYLKYNLILDILEELKLIFVHKEKTIYKFEFTDNKKVNLESSGILMELKSLDEFLGGENNE